MAEQEQGANRVQTGELAWSGESGEASLAQWLCRLRNLHMRNTCEHGEGSGTSEEFTEIYYVWDVGN